MLFNLWSIFLCCKGSFMVVMRTRALPFLWLQHQIYMEEHINDTNCIYKSDRMDRYKKGMISSKKINQQLNEMSEKLLTGMRWSVKNKEYCLRSWSASETGTTTYSGRLGAKKEGILMLQTKYLIWACKVKIVQYVVQFHKQATVMKIFWECTFKKSQSSTVWSKYISWQSKPLIDDLLNKW